MQRICLGFLVYNDSTESRAEIHEPGPVMGSWFQVCSRWEVKGTVNIGDICSAALTGCYALSLDDWVNIFEDGDSHSYNEVDENGGGGFRCVSVDRL